jgi:molybdate transport system substrate-binding protein
MVWILLSGGSVRGAEILVAAAASLQKSLTEIAEKYRNANPTSQVILSFGGSGALQSQIENGAPVDVFLSAAEAQMDALERRGLLMDGTRRALLTNALVLIAPIDSRIPTDLQGLASPAIRHIAIGEPNSVPAGRYALQTLNFLRLEESVKNRLILAKDVRQVLTYVETGEAEAGFVYRTDSQTSKSVRVVAEAPANAHDPVIVSGAVLADSQHADTARKFLEFLSGPEAAETFHKAGFGKP